MPQILELNRRLVELEIIIYLLYSSMKNEE